MRTFSKDEIQGFFIGLLAVTAIFLSLALSTSCPSCKKWFVRVTDRYEVTGEESHTETRTNYRWERDMDGKDRQVYYTEWVRVTTTYYHNWLHCRDCNYQWEDNTESRREWSL